MDFVLSLASDRRRHRRGPRLVQPSECECGEADPRMQVTKIMRAAWIVRLLNNLYYSMSESVCPKRNPFGAFADVL
jgi:hypothetical protein